MLTSRSPHPRRGPVYPHALARSLPMWPWLWVWLMLAAAPLAGAAPGVAAEPAAIELRQAEFLPVAASGEPAPASVVSLPDTWAQRGLATHGSARYRLHFTLAQVPAQPWALSFTRISSSRRVFLNGVLIQDESPLGRQHPEPDLIDLPQQLLRTGANRIELEVSSRIRGGLSVAELGPAATLRARADHAALWERELPRSLNIGMAIVAALMLLIRWRRPSENTIALFGALALLGSLRNYTYFADVSLLPTGLTNWLFYSLQIWTAALFVGFALSLSPRRRPWTRLLLGAVLVLPLLAALPAPLDLLPLLRTYTYPLLLLFAALAVRMIWLNVRENGGAANHSLVASLGAVVLAGVHDYAFQQGHLALTGTFWMPYVMPFALGLYALVLLSRFVSAIGELEALRDELEARVAQRTVALEEAVTAHSRFVAAASHDLRQPVVTIGLLAGLVREQVAALPAVRTMIDRLYEAVGSMEALLNGLMDLSRLEPGKLTPRLQAVPLAWIFDAISLHEQTAATLKGLRLRFRATQLVVHSDPVLLDQIIRNLVSNAIRYTERGGVLVGARLRGAGSPSPHVIVQVWDSGQGIPAQEQARVFEEFVQLDNPGRDRSKGQGLGLAIVRRGIHALGHRLSLRSRPGRGSCFTIELPLARHTLEASVVAAPAPDPLHGRRLWLIEDDAAVREALTLRLQNWGARVTAFGGIRELRAGLDHAAQHGAWPELVVSDQRLADGSGIEAIALIRVRTGHAVPSVIVTGNTAPADLARLDTAGLPVLHKPFRAAELLALLHAALPAETR